MPLIIPANSAVSGGFDVDNSVRYNGSNDSMNRTFAAGNQKTWTWSMWIKRSKLSVDQTLFGRMTSTGDPGWFSMSLNPDDTITFGIYNTNYRKTNRKFRDVSAWMHIVLAFDTTQGTAANRIKFYINGVEETSFSISNNPSQNFDAPFNANAAHFLGIQPIPGGYEKYYGGYISEVTFIDGAANAVTDFGEFDEDSGIWKPISVSGLTFGTNGFYLPFTNSSALGEDYSGEDHDWTTVNLAAIDQTTDTCTNNFATLNPLGMPSTNTTFTEGNLTVNVASGSSFWSVPTIGVSSGKWYVEGKLVTGTASSGVTYSDYGFADRSDSAGQSLYSSSARVFWLSAWDSKINYRTGGSTTAGLQTGKTGLSQGDFFQLYLDMDNELMYWGRNGSVTNSTGISFNGKESLTGEYFFAFADQFTSGTYKYSTNFGQGSIDGSAAANYNDANGFGNFKYNPSVTTDEGDKDFLALCTKNLAEYG